MTHTVWKFPVPMENGLVRAPKYAKPLSVGFQGKDLMVWMLVDPDMVEFEYRFAVFGTGHAIIRGGESLTFVGTAHLHTLGLVFHVFIQDDLGREQGAAE